MVSKELENAINSYEKYYETHGISEELINAYVMACGTAYKEDIEYGKQVSARAKEIIEKFISDLTGGNSWELEKYAFANKTNYEILDKLYEVLLLEAQNYNVDSGFRYLERKREPNERFYMPRRKQLVKIGLVDALQSMIDDKYDILCISLIPGAGKAQPLYSKVLTPNGFITMGEVKVGTKVIAGNGNIANVVGVYPQGLKDIYEITFDDGSKCRCSDEHLWTVQTIEDRNKKEYRTIPTNKMLNNLWRGKQRNYSIDYIPQINMESSDIKINPYLLGFLLGDGCFTKKNISFATADKEIVEKLKGILPKNHTIKQDAEFNYRIKCNNGGGSGNKGQLRLDLEYYELFGKYSHNKFIPKDYLSASYYDRLELLRGLLDSDGDVCKNGYAISFTSTSEQLANDVRQLVLSLGGYVSISKKKCFYKNKNGEKIKCRDSYRLTIQFMKSNNNPFFVKRKADRYKPKTKTNKRFIDKIEYVGKEECQCIMIDDECHLYITDDYIITHNTTIEKFFACLVIGWFPKDFNLFYSHSGDITRMFYDGTLDIVTNQDEYCWNDIFPELSVTRTDAKMEQFNVSKYKAFPSMQCTSVGSKNAGKVRASKFLLVDDMIGGIEEALNPTILDKLWNKYAVDARQRKIKGCKEIHIATRWSVNDVIGRIIRMYDGNTRVKVISIPDIDPITGKSNFDYEFGGFDEAFFADQQLLMDDISYKCLYKQEPIEREGLLYHKEEMRRYTSLPNREPDAILGVCDTKTTGVDYMVLTVFYQYDDDYYLVDCVCDDSTDFAIQQEKLAGIILEHNMQQCEFESNAGGSRLAHEVNKIVKERGGRCNVTTKPTSTNKETRIIVNSDWVKKNCLFKDSQDYAPKSDYGRFMSFMFTYSISGKNRFDDVVDCLANFVLYITKKDRLRPTIIMQSPI